MAAEELLVNVKIMAMDYASQVLRGLGITGSGAFGMLQIGAAAVGAGIAAVGVASIDLASKFDQSMQKIAALTTTSASQMDWYKQKLLEMAPQLDQSPDALAKGLYFVISAGYNGQQALDILSYSAKAAAANMTDMASVSDLLTTAMNAYKSQNLQAGHAMDDLTKIVVNGKVTMSSLATSFGFVAVTAANAGLNFDQASAAVSTLSQTAGEHGARRIMMDLDNLLRGVGINTADVAKKAQSMGLSFDAAGFAGKSFIEKLQYLAQITGGVGNLDKTKVAAYEASGDMNDLALATANANKKFMTLVGGAAAFLPAAMLLSDQGKTYNTILGQMGGNGEATAAAFDKMRQSTGQQWNMFKVTLESIATIIGLKLLPAVNSILTGLINAGHGIIAFINTKQGINALMLALLGIASVVGGILAEAIATAVGAALPLILTMAGIVAAGILLGKIIQAIIQHFGGWQKVLQDLKPLIDTVKAAVQEAGQEFQKAWNNPDVQNGLKQLQDALPQLVPLLKIIGVIVGVVLVAAFHLVVASIDGLLAALPGLLQFFRGIIEIVGGLARILVDVFTGNWKDLPGAVKQIGQGVSDELTGIVKSTFEGWGGFFGHFGTVMNDAVRANDRTNQQLEFQQQQHLSILAMQQAKYYADDAKAAAQHLVDLQKQLTQTTNPIVRQQIQTQIQDTTQRENVDKQKAQQAVQQAHQHAAAAHKALSHPQGRTWQDAGKQAIGDWFSSFGTGLHVGFGLAQTQAQQGVQKIGGAFMWLYSHNYIVELWTNNVLTTFQSLRTDLGKAGDALKTYFQTKWDEIRVDAANGWTAVKKAVGDALANWWDNLYAQNIFPIVQGIQNLGPRMLQAGKDLFHQLMDGAKLGIEEKLMNLRDAFGGVLSVLGFHDVKLPGFAAGGTTPGGWFRGAEDGPELLTRPGVYAAPAGSHVYTASQTASILGNLAGGGSGGGSGPITINASFPNATDRNEIQAALEQLMDQRERRNYQRARRAGYGGGLRAGL